MRKFFRIALLALAVPVGLLCLWQGILVVSCPRYTPGPTAPFSGPTWANPYGTVHEDGQWLRANFHAHSNKWGAYTFAKKNTSQELVDVYERLGYDVIGISDYQAITPTSLPLYVPCYEHGVNVKKTHYLSIGATKVYWYLMGFPLTFSQKQHVINHLKENASLVALAHPGWNNGHSPKHVRQLQHYDLFEVLNDFWRSEALWDVSLSSGHHAMLLASDDAHNVFKPTDIARCVTMIYAPASTPDTQPEALYEALRAGRTYGIDVDRRIRFGSIAQKRERLDSLARLQSCAVVGDTLTVCLSKDALEYRFIGQDGRLLKTWDCAEDGMRRAWYRLDARDTYVRVKITLPDSSYLYLNPVYRTL